MSPYVPFAGHSALGRGGGKKKHRSLVVLWVCISEMGICTEIFVQLSKLREESAGSCRRRVFGYHHLISHSPWCCRCVLVLQEGMTKPDTGWGYWERFWGLLRAGEPCLGPGRLTGQVYPRGGAGRDSTRTNPCPAPHAQGTSVHSVMGLKAGAEPNQQSCGAKTSGVHLITPG